MNPSRPTPVGKAAPLTAIAVPGIFPQDQTEAELRESRRALATLMDNLPGMAYRCLNDPDWTMQVVSQGSLALTGLFPEELVGNARISYGQIIHPDDRDRVQEEVAAALAIPSRFRIVYRIVTIDGIEKWVWEQGCGIFSEGGELTAIEGFITDVTEARQAEADRRQLLLEQAARAAAEKAERRAEFVAEAGRILASSFDYETALASLARLFVPEIADVCTVAVLTPSGDLARVGVAHSDPALEARLRESPLTSVREFPPHHPICEALLAGRSTFLPEVDAPADLAGWPGTYPAVDIGPSVRSLLTVPLVIADHIVGVLTTGIATGARRFDQDDLALAEELARRAAIAVENARLFHDAQQATKARDQVLAVVAHDLRNPLNTISIASQLLQRATLDDRYRSQIEIILSSAGRMNRMIQDLLEVVQIETGRLSIAPELEAMAALIEESIAMHAPVAEGRSIVLRNDCPPDLPAVLCDGARVLQVLSNLIGNAIKFTPLDGIIRVHCVAMEGFVRVGVTDSGPGIPAEQIPHVFGRFWQANAGDRRGIGLGLSIAMGIVEAHGGKIWVESAVGRGTTVYFTLPCAPGDGGASSFW